MKQTLTAIRAFLFLSVVTGLIYPAFSTIIGLWVFPSESQGSLVLNPSGEALGSRLIAQKFTDPRYFWSRPSAADYATVASGASNLGPMSANLKKIIEERKATLQNTHSEAPTQPADLLMASGSGLDPHISVEAALFQTSRVASSRNLRASNLLALVEKHTEGRQWGIFGEPRVNVLELNLALDQIHKE